MNLKIELERFTGTENVYKNPLHPVLYTDGIRYMAQKAGAYWLIDLIGFEISKLQRIEPFIAIHLIIENRSAVIKATDGNQETLYFKSIRHTDFPEGVYLFFLTDNVLMLPTEY